MLFVSAWLAQAYLKLGRCDDARRVIVRALQWGEGHINAVPFSLSYASVARVLVHLADGELLEALARARTAVRLAEQSRFRLEMGASHRALGMAHEARGEREEAETAYRRSLEILEDDRPRPEFGQTLLAFGRFKHGDDAVEGRRLLERARDLFAAIGATGWLAEADAAAEAEAAGAQFFLDTITAVEVGNPHIVRAAAEVFRAPALIIAAGSSLRSLGIAGEERLLGRGVSHCASCDGPFFKGRDVGVVGGGDAALDEALVLAEHAARVTIFHRGPTLRAQQTLLERARANVRIAITLNAVVEEIIGEEAVAAVRLRDVTSGATRTEELKAVFVYVGLEPNTAFLRGVLSLDPTGHIETDVLMRTSVAGIFAAGDIRQNSVAQLAAVAGDGATAAVAACRYLVPRFRSS